MAKQTEATKDHSKTLCKNLRKKRHFGHKRRSNLTEQFKSGHETLVASRIFEACNEDRELFSHATDMETYDKFMA